MILVVQLEKPINVIQIAKRTSSSKHHVSKVIQQLVKQDFWGSVRGPSGGFFIKKNAAEIDFLNIYEAIEGKLKVNKCAMEKPDCTFEKCIFNNIVKKVICNFIDYLKSQRLSDYL